MAELTRGGFFAPPVQYRVRPDPVQNRVKKTEQNKQISNQTCPYKFQFSNIFDFHNWRPMQFTNINDFLTICKYTYMFVKKTLIRSGFYLKHVYFWPKSSFPLEQKIILVLIIMPNSFIFHSWKTF